MKAEVTRTLLHAMPGEVWVKYFFFTMYGESMEEYTPIQKTAALCMRYYYSVSDNEGHAVFFGDREAGDTGDLAQALIDIGAPEFAENLREAAKGVPSGDYERADAWFFENESTLFEAMEGWRESHFDDFFEIVDEDYTLCPPQGIIWLGVFEAAFFFLLMVLFAALNPRDAWLIIPTFTALASIGLLLIVYVKIWKVRVKKDVITVRQPFRGRRTALFEDVSQVKHRRNGFVVYAHGKKFLSVERGIDGREMFLAQLDLYGKIADVQTDEITIRQSTPNIIEGVLAVVFSIGALIWMFPWERASMGILEKGFFLALMLWSLWFLWNRLQWKVIVYRDSFKVKRAFGFEVEYQFSEITQVVVDDRNAVVSVGTKKVAKVPTGSEGYATLAQGLSSAGISFHRKGQKK